MRIPYRQGLRSNPELYVGPTSTFTNINENGEGGIRTHVPLRTNGFQDRLVMTTSIPLHMS